MNTRSGDDELYLNLPSESIWRPASLLKDYISVRQCASSHCVESEFLFTNLHGLSLFFFVKYWYKLKMIAVSCGSMGFLEFVRLLGICWNLLLLGSPSG